MLTRQRISLFAAAACLQLQSKSSELQSLSIFGVGSPSPAGDHVDHLFFVSAVKVKLHKKLGRKFLKTDLDNLYQDKTPAKRTATLSPQEKKEEAARMQEMRQRFENWRLAYSPELETRERRADGNAQQNLQRRRDELAHAKLHARANWTEFLQAIKVWDLRTGFRVKLHQVFKEVNEKFESHEKQSKEEGSAFAGKLWAEQSENAKKMQQILIRVLLPPPKSKATGSSSRRRGGKKSAAKAKPAPPSSSPQEPVPVFVTRPEVESRQLGKWVWQQLVGEDQYCQYLPTVEPERTSTTSTTSTTRRTTEIPTRRCSRRDDLRKGLRAARKHLEKVAALKYNVFSHLSIEARFQLISAALPENGQKVFKETAPNLDVDAARRGHFPGQNDDPSVKPILDNEHRKFFALLFASRHEPLPTPEEQRDRRRNDLTFETTYMDQFGAPALPAEMSFAGSVVRENSIRQRFTHQYAKKGQQGTTARYLEEVERDRQARNETFFRPDTRTDPRLAGFSSTREWIMEQVLLGSTGSTSFPRGAPATTRNEGTLLDNIKDLGQLLAEWQKNINEAAFLWVLKLEFVKQELLKRILILETEFLARREPYVDEHLAKWIEEREEAGIRSYPRRDYLPAVVNVNGAFAIDEERTRAEKARLIQEMIQEETRIVTGKILELQNQWTNTQLTEEERAKLVRVRKELKYLQEFFQPDRNEAGQELRTGDDRRRDSNRPSWEPMTVFFPWPDKNFKEKVRRTSLMTRLDSRNYTTNADTDTREQHQQQQHQASSEDNRIFRQSFLQALQRKFQHVLAEASRRLKSELDEAIRPVVPPNSADNNSPPVQVQNLLVSQALPRNIVGRAGLRLTVPLMKERFFKEIILENDMPEVHLGGGFVPPSSSTASGGGRAGLNPSTTASSSSTSSQQQHSIYRTTGAAPAPAGPQPQVAGSSSGRGGVTYLGPALEVHVQTEPVQSSAGAAERQVAGTSRAREVEPRAAQEPQAAAPAAQLASAPARPQRRGIVNRRLSEFATQGGGQQR